MLCSKVCERCKNVFECNADKIENCPCHKLNISPDTIKNIKADFKDCMCIACLQILNDEHEKFNKSGSSSVV